MWDTWFQNPLLYIVDAETSIVYDKRWEVQPIREDSFKLMWTPSKSHIVDFFFHGKIRLLCTQQKGNEDKQHRSLSLSITLWS